MLDLRLLSSAILQASWSWISLHLFVGVLLHKVIFWLAHLVDILFLVLAPLPSFYYYTCTHALSPLCVLLVMISLLGICLRLTVSYSVISFL